MKDEIKEMIDKIKKCLMAGYDIDIITQEEMGILWNYITNLHEDYDRAMKLYDKEIEKLTAESTEWESKCYNLQSELERYQHYFKTSGIEELMEENKQLKNKNKNAIDKLYCYGEVFDRDILKQFQKEMLDILQESDKE